MPNKSTVRALLFVMLTSFSLLNCSLADQPENNSWLNNQVAEIDRIQNLILKDMEFLVVKGKFESLIDIKTYTNVKNSITARRDVIQGFGLKALKLSEDDKAKLACDYFNLGVSLDLIASSIEKIRACLIGNCDSKELTDNKNIFNQKVFYLMKQLDECTI